MKRVSKTLLCLALMIAIVGSFYPSYKNNQNYIEANGIGFNKNETDIIFRNKSEDDGFDQIKKVSFYLNTNKIQKKNNRIYYGFGKKELESEIREIIKESELFIEKRKGEISVSEEEIEKYYNANKNDYDKINYRIAKIPKTFKDSKKIAEDLYQRTYDEFTWDKILSDLKLPGELNEKNLNNGYKDVDNKKIADWLFSSEREINTLSLLEDKDNYYVTLFLKRYKDKYNHVKYKEYISEDLKKIEKRGNISEREFQNLTNNSVNLAERDAKRDSIGESVENFLFSPDRIKGDYIVNGNKIFFITSITETEPYKENIKEKLLDEKIKMFERSVLKEIKINFLN